MSHIYLEYSFEISPGDPGSEILLAELGELPFESFEETESGLKAYIRKTDWQADILGELNILNNPSFQIKYLFREIPPENWNETWETHFTPIEIDHSCRVRAPFHEKKEVTFDIVIEPKMSFGTGHHETTHMMLQLLLDLPLEAKAVLDMGCGTAVLAILAAMKGANPVDAIDIDHWSYLNSLENTERNRQSHIRVYEGDVSVIPDKKYDLILANINRNILLADIQVYAKQLAANADLMLSGFYEEDEAIIREECEKAHLHLKRKLSRNNWIALHFQIG
jgi:ribosomal protein L11 methyltransferase